MDRIKSIKKIDVSSKEQAAKHWNHIAKPLHSMGIFEEYINRIAGITGNLSVRLDKRCVVVMCADNGVVSEGVTQSDNSVTKKVALAMAHGDGNINNLAHIYNADVIPVDIGMGSKVEDKKVLDRKVSFGTSNIAQGPAMSINQACRAITVGMDIVKMCRDNGYDIIVTGEMGIGNTTTSAALAAVILDEDAENVTGRGAGLDDEGYKRKLDAVKRAIRINNPDKNNPVELLAKLGGYDIAGMTGLFLGGGVYHIPVVIDGFISAVAAHLAAMINSSAAEYMFCSHASAEPAAGKILKSMNMEPVIMAGMHLGEGTGGIMLLPLLDGALSVYNSGHLFDKMDISQYREYS